MGPRYRSPTAAEVCCRDFIVSQRSLYNLYGYYDIQHTHSNAVTYHKIKLYHMYTYLHNSIYIIVGNMSNPFIPCAIRPVWTDFYLGVRRHISVLGRYSVDEY